jgi:ferritin-like metal-binding protein YciE
MARTSTNGSTTAKRSGSKSSASSRKVSSATSSAKEGKTKREGSLEEFFEKELKDIYSAEMQLLEALPKMVRAAYSEDLQDAFDKHLHETERQVERLEKVFDRLDMDKSDNHECKAMKGLLAEADEIMEEFEEGPVRDSALIIGAQKVEHYEIASYGSLCELAHVLGYNKIAEILGRTLEEEEVTDETLTYIAQDVNDEAAEMSYEEEEAY